MSEMRERVAMALESSMQLVWRARVVGGPYEKLNVKNAEELLANGARAVIEAMREPTEAMCNAEHDSPGYGMISMTKPNALDYSDPDIVWRAMIDEALR